MSLYNLVNGYNPYAGICLAILKLAPTDIPRFRDAWLSSDGTKITLLTRTGGNNRADYVEEHKKLEELSNFEYTRDDSFDSTFAHFFYEVPEKYRTDTAIIAKFIEDNGRKAAENGPGTVVAALKADKTPEARGEGNAVQEPSEDDPALDAAFKAYNRLVTALQAEQKPSEGNQ